VGQWGRGFAPPRHGPTARGPMHHRIAVGRDARFVQAPAGVKRDAAACSGNLTMKTAFRSLYAPLMWFGFIGAAAYGVAVRGLAEAWLLPLFALALAGSFAAEAWLPYERRWNDDHGDRRRDLLHALVNEAANVLALAGIPALAAWSPMAASAVWRAPFVLQLMFAIIIADLGITLAHRASHRWAALWRLHAVHHSVRRLYGFNGLMKHPLHQAVEALAGIAPLLLLGMPQDVAALLAFAIAVQLLLQHGNVDMRMGPLRHVFAWAPLHRYHHIRYGKAGDVNFGLFFTVWDRLLGTAFDGGAYRLSSADLGIGSRPDYPDAYFAQLAEPFRRRAEQRSPEPPAGLRRALPR
jgi:sterol desaturase/sphingolipid hydroxylase (fatty acid hydroxylase superfamily)